MPATNPYPAAIDDLRILALSHFTNENPDQPQSASETGKHNVDQEVDGAVVVLHCIAPLIMIMGLFTLTTKTTAWRRTLEAP